MTRRRSGCDYFSDTLIDKRSYVFHRFKSCLLFLKVDNGESFCSWSWSEIGLKVASLVNHFKYGKYEQIYVVCKFSQIYLNNLPQKTKSSVSDLR